MVIEFIKCTNIQAYMVTYSNKLEHNVDVGTIYQDVSGYWYMDFDTVAGGLDEFTVKAIYEKLKDLNSQLDSDINSYFMDAYFKQQKELLDGSN